MRGYKKVKTSSGNTYYIEMKECDVSKRDELILMATAPVITLMCILACAVASGMIKIF